MDQSSSTKPGGPAWSQHGNWYLIALLAQLGWGAYPALLRYLQTVTQLPGFSLLAAGNLMALLLVSIPLRKRLSRRAFLQPITWVFGIMVVLRGVTNLFATRYTLATYAQLIYLMTPFVVVLLSRIVLRERLPAHTWKAMAIASLGAIMILSQNLQLSALSATVSQRNDPLGIAMAIASSFFLALYMIVARRSSSQHTPGSALLITHLLSLMLFASITSVLVGEDLTPWQSLTFTDWLVLGLFVLGVLLGANLGQIRSIQHLGAALVSNMMAIRLVSALFFAGILLQERLATTPQIIGTAVVLVTITWYLRQQSQSVPQEQETNQSPPQVLQQDH